MKRVALFVIAVALLGCQTSEPVPEGSTSDSVYYNAMYDQAYFAELNAVQDVYAELNQPCTQDELLLHVEEISPEFVRLVKSRGGDCAFVREVLKDVMEERQ